MSGFPYDERWRNGMDGWRIQIAQECEYEGRHYDGGEEGEVTGYEHATQTIYVVFDEPGSDGKRRPRPLPWEMMVPA